MPKKAFIKIQNLKSILTKCNPALKDVDRRVARQSLGERDINAICPTQIPNDPYSISRRKCKRSILDQTDSTYEEVQREEVIDELQYSEFVKLFEDTYFKEMYDALTQKV